MGWLALVVAAWIAGRWPDLRRETAAVAASPWLSRAEAALSAGRVDAAGRALAEGLARDPASAALTALMRRIAAAARVAGGEWRVLPPPRLPIRLADLTGGDAAVMCRAATPARLAMILPAVPAEVFAGETKAMPTDLAEPTSRPATAMPTTEAADAATEGYRLLSSGDRRGAAGAFRAALARDPNDPRAAAWRAQLDSMTDRWSGEAYAYLRASGLSAAASAAPVLGGGQSGAQLAYTLDPLAARPFAILGRASVANSDRDSAQTSLGLRWRPVPPASIAVERLAGIGATARSAWNVRLAAGLASPERAAVDWSAYAEGGVIGARRRDTYAAALGHAGVARPLSRMLSAGLALGGWASVQRTDRTVGRAELGPTLRLRWRLKAPIDLALDYRLRVAGNAKPGSGPALTVSTAF